MTTATPGRTGPFREPAYRYWFSSQILSSSGLQTQNIGVAWVIFLQTHSGLALAALTIVTQGPGLLLSVFAGALLDRRGSRLVLLVTQSSALVTGCVLGTVSLARAPSLPVIFGLSFLTGVINAFDGPARQTIVADLVGRAQLGKAVSLYEVSLSLARAAGPALGGILLNVAGAPACFFFNAGTFVFPILVLAFFRPKHAMARGHRAPRASGAREALGFALRSARIRSCLLFAAVAGMVVTTSSYFPKFASESLGLGSGGYGTLVACLGIGALPGAVLAARLSRRNLGRRVVLAGFATAAATLATGLAPTAVLAYLGAILIGVTSISLIALANTLTQLLSPPRSRGGIMGVWTMALPGMSPLTGLGAGLLADALGARSVFVVIATAMALVALGCRRPLNRPSPST